MASVSALPVIEFLRPIFCCPNRKVVFPPQNWQQNINQLARIHPNTHVTRQINKIANCPVFLENFSIQQDWKLLSIKFWDNFWTDNYSDTESYRLTLVIFCSKIKIRQIIPGVNTVKGLYASWVSPQILPFSKFLVNAQGEGSARFWDSPAKSWLGIACLMALVENLCCNTVV